MKTAIVLLMFVLTGCASLQNAGTASYSVKPLPDGSCCEVTVNNGKEIAVLDAVIIKKGNDYEVRLHEEGVAAFEGQRIAAGAAKEIATEAAKAAIMAITIPATAATAGAVAAPLLAPK